MKVIVAGSREVDDYDVVVAAIEESGLAITTLVSGHARGVDQLAELWAKKNKIEIVLFIPDWHKHGKIAGYRRNEEMAEYADALIAVWDGVSKGTRYMIRCAELNHLPMYIKRV